MEKIKEEKEQAHYRIAVATLSQADSIRNKADSIYGAAEDFAKALHHSLLLGKANLASSSDLLRRFRNQLYPLFPVTVSVSYSFVISKNQFNQRCEGCLSAMNQGEVRTASGEVRRGLNFRKLSNVDKQVTSFLFGASFTLFFQRTIDTAGIEQSGDREVYSMLNHTLADSDSLYEASIVVRNDEIEVHATKTFSNFTLINGKEHDYTNSMDFLNSTIWVEPGYPLLVDQLKVHELTMVFGSREKDFIFLNFDAPTFIGPRKFFRKGLTKNVFGDTYGFSK